MKTIYEHVPVPRVAHFGERQTDREAEQVYTRDERIDWLTGMLFVTIKMVVRGNDKGFFPLLERVYREFSTTYGFDEITVTSPTSLPNISIMLRQLLPYAQDNQRHAVEAIDAFIADVER